MKNKIKLIVFFLEILVLCGGCDLVNADVTRDIRHSGYSVSSTEFECPELLPSETSDEKIKFFSNIYAITTDGKFYSLSLSKKFKNDLHCKVPDDFSNKNIKAVMDNKIVKTDDGKFYYIVASGENAAYSEVPSSDSSYGIYRILFNDSSILKVMTVDSSNGYYYALKSDGNVYNIVIVNDNGVVSQVSSSVVYSKNTYDGNIIDFNYAGSSSGTYIRTESQIFRMKAQNSEECSKYADVTCEYKIGLDEGLTKHQDRIIGFSGNFLITDYGKEFSAVG